MQSTSVFLFPFLLYLCHLKCHSRDIITPGNLLSNEGKTLVSAGKIFELGFFNKTSDDGEFRNYVGIWYRASPETVVWVANRDDPIRISHKNSFVAFDDDGNLKVLDSKGNSYFSTELVSASSSNRTAKLFDSGNLVLIDDLLGERLWQSFHYPTDTFLPGMKMKDELKLTAWGFTQKDPSTGNYTFWLNQAGNSKYYILQGTIIYWKGSAPAASANPFNFWELPPFVASMLSNSSKESDSSPNSTPNTSHVPFFNKTRTDNIASVSYTRLVMNSSGEIQLYGWDDNSSRWFKMWSEPQGPCGVYDTCGKFGICNSEIMPLCKCLPGFDPASPDDWTAKKYIGGCSRKLDSNCNKKSEFDTFSNMHSMKIEEPEPLYSEAKNEEDCRKECLGNCNCLAYSYFEVAKPRRGISSTGTVSRCSIWTSDLNNLQEDYTGGFNLSVRAITDIEQGARSGEKAASLNLKALIISISLTAGIVTMCCISYVIYRNKKVARRKAKEIIQGNSIDYLPESESSSKYVITEDDKKRIDVPFFNLKSILVATDNFSDANRLGQGGFGPVYRVCSLKDKRWQ